MQTVYLLPLQVMQKLHGPWLRSLHRWIRPASCQRWMQAWSAEKFQQMEFSVRFKPQHIHRRL